MVHVYFKKCNLSTKWKLNLFYCNSVVGSSAHNIRIAEPLSGIVHIGVRISERKKKSLGCTAV